MHGIHYMNVRLAQGRYDELLAGVRAATVRYPDLVGVQAVLAMVLARSGRCERRKQSSLGCWLAVRPPSHRRRVDATVTALGDAAHVINDTMFAQDLAEAIEPYAGRYAVQSAAASVPIDVIHAELALTLNEPARSAAIAASAAKHAELQQAIIFKARALVIKLPPTIERATMTSPKLPSASAPDCRTDRRPTHHPRRSTAEPNVIATDLAFCRHLTSAQTPLSGDRAASVAGRLRCAGGGIGASLAAPTVSAAGFWNARRASLRGVLEVPTSDSGGPVARFSARYNASRNTTSRPARAAA